MVTDSARAPLQLLARLAGPQRLASEGPVAWRGDAPVTDAAFRARARVWLAAFGACPGQALALYQPDGVEFAAALFAAWHAGKTVYIPGDNLAGTIRNLESRVAHFVGDWPGRRDAVQAAPHAHDSADFSVLDPAFVGVVVFTSGSTGEPQAIPKSLHQLASEVESLERAFGADVGDAIVAATVSHQHIYGLLFKLLWPLAARRPFLAASEPFPEAIRAQLVGRTTALVSGPALLKRLPPELDWTPARVAAVFSSGGPLSPDAVVQCEALLGATPIEVYGSSETGGIAWRRCVRGAGAPWTALPGVRVRDDHGHVAVQSPHLPDTGWFVTADRAVFGADGTLAGTFTLAGRADRIAKVEGKRVSLAAVEQALIASGWASDARVFPLHAGREQLAAVVVPSAEGRAELQREGPAGAARQLRALLAESIERVAVPRRWRFIEALPVNAQGKTAMADLVALFVVQTETLPHATLLEQRAGHVALELSVPANLVYFDGHFDDAPVLPGVALVHWAIHYGRQYLNVQGDFVRMDAVKFHRLIVPGAVVRLEIDWRAESASLVFRVHSGSGPHSSGRVFFAI